MVDLFIKFGYTIQVVCTEGPDRIRELIAMGASFDHGEDGNLHLAREGGHSHHRIVHAADMTGREIERALLEAVVNDPNISVFEHHFAVDLLTCQVTFSLVLFGKMFFPHCILHAPICFFRRMISRKKISAYLRCGFKTLSTYDIS